MKNTIWILVFLIGLSSNLYSQNEILSGFIVLHSNDTIFGELEDEKDIYCSLFCIFKGTDSSNFRQYYPTDIKAYYLSNNRYFVSKKINVNNVNKDVFLQFLIEGELNVYKHKDISRNVHFFIEKEEIGISELHQPTKELVRVDNKSFMKTTKSFDRILRYYMADEPKFRRKIENISVLFSKGLIEIAEEYHNTVCEENNCTIFFYDY